MIAEKQSEAELSYGVSWRSALVAICSAGLVALLTLQALVSLTLKSSPESQLAERLRFSLVSVPKERELQRRERKKPEAPKPKKLKTELAPKKLDLKPLEMKSLQPQAFRPSFSATSGLRVAASFALPAAVRGLVPVFQSPPQYPYKAKRQRIEGFVEVEFTITEQGSVEDLKVVRSEPPRVFDRAALQALARWRFRPQMSSGVAVRRRAVQEIVFRLGEGS